MERIMKYLFDSPSVEKLNLIITKETEIDHLINGLMSGSALKMVK